MTKQDNNTKQNSKEDVVIGSVKRDPLKLFRKQEHIIAGKDMNKSNSDALKKSNNGSTSKIKDSRSKKAFKLAYIATIAVLVVSVLLNIYFVFTNENLSINNITEERQQQLSSITNSVVTKTAQGDYDGAISDIKTNPAFRGNVEGAILEATVRMNQKDYKTAIDILLVAKEQFGMDIAISNALAQAYEALGDKENAIINYSLYLDYLKASPDYPLKESDVEATKKLIESLK